MLELRRLVDKTFQDEGLPELYVSRNDIMKCAEICGPCGQPFKIMNEIPLPTSLTKENRKYAANLIIKYVKANGDKLDEIWTIKKNRLNLRDKKFKYEMNIKSWGIDKHMTCYDEENKVTYLKKNGEYAFSFQNYVNYTTDVLKKALEKEDDYRKELDAFIEWYKEVNQQDERLKELTSCSL
jgi:hypothetical protein